MLGLVQLGRQEFKQDFWDYRLGEHLFICDPTGGGKTHLAYELLEVSPVPRPPVALVMKPVDATPAEWTERLGWKEVKRWPPPPVLPWQDSPPGYTLWPPHTMSLDTSSLEITDERLAGEFSRALLDAYRRGQTIVFADEIQGLVSELHLQALIIRMLSRARGGGGGLWLATQKPSGNVGAPLPGQVFNCPTHLFFGRDTNRRNIRALADIGGGVNPHYVSEILANLRMHNVDTPRGSVRISEKLYIDKRGPYLAILSPHPAARCDCALAALS